MWQTSCEIDYFWNIIYHVMMMVLMMMILQLPIISKPPSWPINLNPLCLGFWLTKVAMIATEVRQPTIPRAILRRFTFYSMAKLSSHKVITWKRIALTKHWVLNRIAPPSSITIGLIMLYLLPRPWAAISDFRFTFRRGKFSFCAAKSMDDLSLAFRNLHKLHNSRSSVNYLDVAVWTCAR